MTYETCSIGAITDQVNRRYFLPAIQRPYVWSADQVIALFDSLMKGYPISSFMFWAVDNDTKREVRIYRFLEDYRPERQNEAVSPDGRDAVLVLDGQQRLTSLLIGLRGTFAEKAKHARTTNPDAWTQRSLYIDLLKDPEEEDDDGQAGFGVTYGFRFHGTPPRNDRHSLWFKVGRILDAPRPDQLEGLIAEMLRLHQRGGTDFERGLVEATLRRLHAMIWTDEVINFYTETDQSVDRVLDIFVRANDGGTKLSKPDLMMSMITSKWPAGSAREEVFGFVDYINKALPQRNAITRDLVLKACLVLCDLDVKYSVSSFTSEAIGRIESRWPEIKQAIEKTFRLVNKFGISSETLTSLNAVLPITYYLFRTPDYSFRGSSEFERTNAREMQLWLIQSLLMGVFAGNSDRTISLARGTIRDSIRADRGFPAAKLYDVLATNGRMSRLDARAVEELLALKYGKPKTFLALSLLYEGLDWNADAFHVDHIVPQSRVARRTLQGMNLPEHRIREITDHVDRLANLQLLPGTENLEKSDIPFDAWITSRDRHYMDRHLIPQRLDLATAQMLPEFVREREKAIRERLMRFGGSVPA